MVTAYVGVGSNLHDPAQQVEHALQALDSLDRTRVIARSSLYQSAPWGGVAQPDFINAVAQVDTDLDARVLMDSLLNIERTFGRQRDRVRNGPRVIDLDLLWYDDVTMNQPELQLPHPRLRERAFVLVPLAEIAPQFELIGTSVNQLLRNLAAADLGAVRRFDGQATMLGAT